MYIRLYLPHNIFACTNVKQSLHKQIEGQLTSIQAHEAIHLIPSDYLKRPSGLHHGEVPSPLLPRIAYYDYNDILHRVSCCIKYAISPFKDNSAYLKLEIFDDFTCRKVAQRKDRTYLLNDRQWSNLIDSIARMIVLAKDKYIESIKHLNDNPLFKLNCTAQDMQSIDLFRCKVRNSLDAVKELDISLTECDSLQDACSKNLLCTVNTEHSSESSSIKLFWKADLTSMEACAYTYFFQPLAAKYASVLQEEFLTWMHLLVEAPSIPNATHFSYTYTDLRWNSEIKQKTKEQLCSLNSESGLPQLMESKKNILNTLGDSLLYHVREEQEMKHIYALHLNTLSPLQKSICSITSKKLLPFQRRSISETIEIESIRHLNNNPLLKLDCSSQVMQSVNLFRSRAKKSLLLCKELNIALTDCESLTDACSKNLTCSFETDNSSESTTIKLFWNAKLAAIETFAQPHFFQPLATKYTSILQEELLAWMHHLVESSSTVNSAHFSYTYSDMHCNRIFMQKTQQQLSALDSSAIKSLKSEKITSNPPGERLLYHVRQDRKLKLRHIYTFPPSSLPPLQKAICSITSKKLLPFQRKTIEKCLLG